MKDTDFNKLLKFKVINGLMYPDNAQATDYVLANTNNQVYMVAQTPRDLSFHACYFLFMGWLWDKMPIKFKRDRCANKQDMYKYLKLVQGSYIVSLKFKDREAIEFESISFGKMSNDEFKIYVNTQIVALYENILIPLGLAGLRDEAEEEFKGLFSKLI
jgi:hypothetical protein